MSWQDEADEIEARRRKARELGGTLFGRLDAEAFQLGRKALLQPDALGRGFFPQLLGSGGRLSADPIQPLTARHRKRGKLTREGIELSLLRAGNIHHSLYHGFAEDLEGFGEFLTLLSCRLTQFVSALGYLLSDRTFGALLCLFNSIKAGRKHVGIGLRRFP